MPTLPPRIKIGNRWWTVESVPARRIKFGKRKVRGLCDYEAKHLQICMHQSWRWVLSTLAHELTHAMAYEAGIPMSETQVHAFEWILSGVLIKNGELRETFAKDFSLADLLEA